MKCKVRCPNCKKIFWETTDKFDPEITPNGSMLRLLQPYRGNHWPIFGDGIMPTRDGTGTAGTKCAEMDCPQCLAQLAPSGKLSIAPAANLDPALEISKHYICEVCGKEVKSRIGLHGHMRSHKKESDDKTRMVA